MAILIAVFFKGVDRAIVYIFLFTLPDKSRPIKVADSKLNKKDRDITIKQIAS